MNNPSYNISSQGNVGSSDSADTSGNVDVPTDLAPVIPGEAMLAFAKSKALTDNNTSALAYIKNYEGINDEYKEILKNKKAQEATAKYKSTKNYAPTLPNEGVSKIANSGIPFVGIVSKLYVPYPDSTTCHNWDDNFDGWCKKEYGDNKDFGKGMPSQLVWGQVKKYPGACPGGMLGMGGQGRATCATGWAGGSDLSVNTTQCYLTTADFDGACREQAGAGNDYDKGITSDYIFGVKKYLPEGQLGCWSGQRRAQCGLNYAGGKDLSSNSTKCHLWTDDFDGWCRYYAGNGQNPVPSASVPSQDIWGMQKKYAGGCITGQGRAACAKGWSGGVKLKPNSTQCYLWTDDFNVRCKENYGKDWILDTTQSGYGKYAGGCIGGQGRGVCIKKSDLPKDVTLPGAKCGAWDSIGSSWCQNDFGSEFSDIGAKRTDCGGGFGRAMCKNINTLPIGTEISGNKCGQWAYISDQWCKDDYGPDWIMADKKQDNCGWGSGRAICVKPNPEKTWTKCSNTWWGWDGDAACKKALGDKSSYAGNNVDCGKHGGKWYTSKYQCNTW